MINTKKIAERYGGNICRRCINEDYRVHLTPDDCMYSKKKQECPRCGWLSNIVNGFTFSGKRKMLFK